MKNFIKENWFKLGILLILILIAVSIGQYLIEKNRVEQKKIQQDEQKSLVNDLKSQELAEKQGLIDDCIKDAYTELKTLQANFDAGKIVMCTYQPDYCSEGMKETEKWKTEAFKRYENEWVPQCKLGNRVFLDYEYCSAKDMMNETCPK